MGEWKFSEMRKSDKLVDPIQGQFFTTNIVQGLTQALVRETVQNSLDANAQQGGSDLRVRFYLSGMRNAVPTEAAEEYFSGLIPHLRADGNGLRADTLPTLDGPVPFLLIEDFGTRGLEGDVQECDDPLPGDTAKHNFFWFWRNIGRTGKNEGERGRWGLGKSVFPGSSQINTFFGLTVRRDDKQKYLMGECVIKIHKDLEGRKCAPYGYFGEYADKHDAFFVCPIGLAKTPANFERVFQLTRSTEEGEIRPGLSVVIPFPHPEITYSELCKAVIVQYFYPILSGQLRVEVVDGEFGTGIEIGRENIAEALRQIQFPDEEAGKQDAIAKLFDLAQWALALDDGDVIHLHAHEGLNSPLWRKDLYVRGKLEKAIEDKIEAFEAGERVAFEVPVPVHQVGTGKQVARFRVYMEKDTGLSEPDCHFVRAGINVTGIVPPKKKDLRALVVIEDPPLMRLLGDAENPAHTEWQKDSPNFRGNYEHGDRVISFVVAAPGKLYEWLMSPPQGIDTDILQDIFYFEAEHAEMEEDVNNFSGGADGPVPGLAEAEPSPPPPFRIDKVAGGFTIADNPGAEAHSERIEARVAYLHMRGDPLKQYQPLDFDLRSGAITIEAEGVRIEQQAGNVLVVRVERRDFSVKVTGFDELRDLFVKAESR